MRLLAVVMVCTVLLAGACSDDGPEALDLVPVTPSETVEPIDPEEAAGRYHAVCERTVEASVVNECVAVVDAAIDDAIEHGCSIFALDAFVEHGVAWEFESTPDEGFFDSCPLPLSSLMLPAGPVGYESADGAVAGTGLLSTDEVADRYADAADVGEWLAELGHAVSYAASWADGDAVVVTRIDRFDTIDGAIAYAAPSSDDVGDLLTVPGVLQGRVVSSPGTRTATGRVCDVAVNVHAQGDDESMLNVDALVEYFSAQALRVQRALTCEPVE